MALFVPQKKDRYRIRLLLGIIAIVTVMILLCHNIIQAAEGNGSREKKTLEDALSSSIAYCYAIEGTYPENLQYIEDTYGLYYDKDRFFVDYHVQGANIFPDITVIDRKEDYR